MLKQNYRHYEQKQLNENVVQQLTSAQLDVTCQIRLISNMIKNIAQIELKKLGVQHQLPMQVLKRLDKDRDVVVMNCLEYIEKIKAILNDPLTFKAIEHDSTIANEN